MRVINVEQINAIASILAELKWKEVNHVMDMLKSLPNLKTENKEEDPLKKNEDTKED